MTRIFTRRRDFGPPGGLPRALCAAAVLLTGFWPGLPLQAEVVAVALDVPAELRALLEAHLPELRPEAPPPSEPDREALSRRLTREIGELLATEGYFSPTIAVRGSSTADGERLAVTVAVGPRTSVTVVAIEFRGAILTEPARIEALRRDWTLTQGMPFRQEDWDSAKRRLEVALLAEDFAAGRIAESRAEVDPARAGAALSLTVDSGPRFRVGPIEVSGLERYRADLVERYNPMAPGEAYHEDRLLDFQALLQSTPYFSSAVVELANDPATADAAPVRVTVRERKPRRIGLAAGYSTNTGYRGELIYRDHNLLGRAWDLSSGLRLEQARRFLYADVLLPPTSRDYRDSFGVVAEREEIQGLATTRYAAGAVRTRLRGRIETRLALNLGREKRSVAGVDHGFSQALTADWGWTYRDVDNALDPRRGYVWSVAAGGAARLLLSDQNFVRVHSRLQRFFPMGTRDSLVVRGELGAVVAPSRRGIPESFLFRAGGAQSVRGYAYRSLGAREAGAVVGARYLAVVSAEYVHWLDGEWGLAAFADAGDAADDRGAFRWHKGYGAGARWKSPVGPLALDVAYGERLSKWRLHFSVAIAF